jgi:hypothetical protein
MNEVARKETKAVARPLKVLIPLIQGELQRGDDAGLNHYAKAGEMLNEAKGQVGHGGWTKWLSKNFDLSDRQAQRYMRMARHRNEIRHGAAETQFTSLRHLEGDRERDREARQSKQHQAFKKVMRDIDRDEFVQQRQTLDDEIKLHRELAEELIDAGYRALATKLHPDRGGSKEAMTRLSRVRDELKTIALSRRFV